MKIRKELTDVLESDLDRTINLLKNSKPIFIDSIKQPDGNFTIVTIFETPPDNHLGKLSERFESRGDPSAIGRDSTGGFSYGTYQIASKKGAILEFLKFLENTAPAFFDVLKTAGGDPAARAGESKFKASWKKLAEDPAFDESQYEFIKNKYYDIQVVALKEIGLDVDTRSVALQNVVWSVAVQHGANTKLIQNSLTGKTISSLTDDVIIRAIYDERSKVDVHFASSTDQVKKSVKNRFAEERNDALSMLA